MTIVNTTTIMEDYIIRAISKEANVRALLCSTTHLANDICDKHETAATATAALTQALTGGALLGAMLKVGHRLAMRIEGNGVLGKLIVESDSYGVLRGYVGDPTVNLPVFSNGRQNVASAIGVGLLTVAKDVKLKALHTSSIALPTSEIDQDITQFLLQSEQIPSDVRIGATVGDDGRVVHAGGILLQSMPPHNAPAFVALVKEAGDLPLMDEMLANGRSPEQVLSRWFGDVEFEVLEKRPLHFRCSCNRERTAQALISLGKDGLQELLDLDGQAEIDCQFCRQSYTFDGDDLRWMINKNI